MRSALILLAAAATVGLAAANQPYPAHAKPGAAAASAGVGQFPGNPVPQPAPPQTNSERWDEDSGDGKWRRKRTLYYGDTAGIRNTSGKG